MRLNSPFLQKGLPMHLETHYDRTYARLTRPFRTRPWAIRGLFLLNGGLVILMYIAYPLLLWQLWQQGGLAGNTALQKAFWIPALSFLLLTLVRSKINRPRPYEAWPLQPLLPRNKQGESFPSRHVFSSTIIAMTYLYFQPPLGLAFLAVSLASAVVRVLAGVHYPSDVAAGMGVGVLAGLFYWAIA